MNLEDLSAYGANIEEGLERCMGNEGFYLRLVETVKSDESVAKLGEALQANDLDAAFETAHSLKGVAGNLALTPLYEPVVELTELLRKRTEMDYAPLYAKVSQEWDRFAAL